MTESAPLTERRTGFWTVLAALLATTVALALLSQMMLGSPCLAVLAAVAVLAYPFWLTLHEAFLFRRRVLLEGVTQTDGRVRRWFWRGRIVGFLLIFPALLLALLLLAVSVRLSVAYWVLLVLDGILLALLYAALRSRAGREIRADRIGVALRRWPLGLLNGVLLTAALFGLNFAVLGAPDLREVPWYLAAEQGYNAISGVLACPGLGALAGFLAAVEYGSWALAQQFIPTLALPEWELLAWILFVLQLGFLAYLITHLYLGVLTALDAWTGGAESFLDASTSMRSFVLAILILALPSVYAVLKLRDLDPQALAPVASEALGWVDPCRRPDPEWQRLQTDWQAQWDTDLAALEAEVAERVDAELDELFSHLESGVDAYLDWYFTLLGEYQRLAALAAGDLATRLAERFEAHVFTDTDFAARLETLETHLTDHTFSMLAHLSEAGVQQFGEQLRAHPCGVHFGHGGLVPALERDLWRAGGAAAGASGAGVGTAVLAKKVVASTMAKLAAKESMQVAAMVAAKLAAKKGAGVLAAGLTGAALCAASGPIAVACGVGAAAVTWVALDKAALAIDSRLSRDRMRADILEVLEQEKAALRAALVLRQQAVVAAATEQLVPTTDGLFIPARDRFNPRIP